MKKVTIATNYYENIGQDYLLLVNKYVRKYSEMVSVVAEIILQEKISNILDIGQGVGNIEKLLFSKKENLKITCVDKERVMCETTSKNLLKHIGNVTIVQKDIMRFKPKQNYEIVFTNMTLHNIIKEEKKELLERIFRWLVPKGLFIWGDLISFKKKSKIKEIFEIRKRYAVRQGENPRSQFFIQSFEKEEKMDEALTKNQTFASLKQVGFIKCELVWEHDNFGIFTARKP